MPFGTSILIDACVLWRCCGERMCPNQVNLSLSPSVENWQALLVNLLTWTTGSLNIALLFAVQPVQSSFFTNKRLNMWQFNKHVSVTMFMWRLAGGSGGLGKILLTPGSNTPLFRPQWALVFPCAWHRASKVSKVQKAHDFIFESL